MGIYAATMLFVVFILGYVVIIEVFTVLFRMTGLTEDKARFQVISMLTNSGFTTQESEIIISSRRRRRLAQITMIFGYSFTVTIVSTIVNVIIQMVNSQFGEIVLLSIVLVAFVALYFSIKKIPVIKISIDKLIRKLAGKIMFRKGSNRLLILDSYGSNIVAELVVEAIPEALRNKTLQESKIREMHGIQVLVIKTVDKISSNVGANDTIHQNDRLVMFGSLKSITLLFGIGEI